MPNFVFVSPEGKRYSVGAPEGATREQAFQILQTKLSGSNSPAPQQTVEEPSAPEEKTYGALDYAGRRFMRGLHNTAAGVDIAAGGVARKIGLDGAADYFHGKADEFRDVAKGWEQGKPSGIGSKIAGVVAEAVPTLAGFAVNPVTGVMLATAPSFTDAADSVDKGLSTNRAIANVVTDATLNAVGAKIPATFGKTVPVKVATGLSGNVAVGAAGDLVKNTIAGDNEAVAKKYDPLNAEARLADLLFGTAATAPVVMRGRSRSIAPQDIAQPVQQAAPQDAPQPQQKAAPETQWAPERPEFKPSLAELLNVPAEGSGRTIHDVISALTGSPNTKSPSEAVRAEINRDSISRKAMADINQGELAKQVKLYGDELPPQYRQAPVSLEKAVEAIYAEQGINPEASANAFTRARLADDMIIPSAQRDITQRENTREFARQAFDVAAARQRRADADLANHGTIAQDYQGGNSAAGGGVVNGNERAVYMVGDHVFEPVRDALTKEPIIKDGHMMGEFTDVSGNKFNGTVKADKVSVATSPANPRMAQDFMARSSEPRKGVGEGTMAQERMPRRSTDRISGDKFGGEASHLSDPYTTEPRNPSGNVDVEQAPKREGLKAPRKADTINNEADNTPQSTALQTVNGEGVSRPYDMRPDTQPKLPAPPVRDALPAPEKSIRIDGKGNATRETPEQQNQRLEQQNQRIEQQNQRIEAERKAGIVSDYSRNELGNTAKNIGRTDGDSISAKKSDGQGVGINEPEKTSRTEQEKAPEVPKTVAKAEQKSKKPKEQKHASLLSTINKMGGIRLADKWDVTGEKSFARGGWNTAFKKASTKSIEQHIENGDLDEYLPYHLRQGSADFRGDSYDPTEARNYLVDRIRNGEAVLPYDVEMELRYKDIAADDAIQSVVDDIDVDEVNRLLREAGYDERVNNENANEPVAKGEDSGSVGSEGTDGAERGGESEPRSERNSDAGSEGRSDLLGDDTANKQAVADAERAKDAKRNAGDSNSSDFVLTGSDRAADQAAARGAQDLFSEPQKQDNIHDELDDYDQDIESIKRDYGVGGSEFYSGIPVDKVFSAAADAAKKILNSDFVQKQIDETKAIRKAFKDAAEADKRAAGTNDGAIVRGAKLAKALASGAINSQVSILDGIAKKHNSSAMRDLVGMFTDRAGTDSAGKNGATYYQEIEQHFTRRMNSLADVFGDDTKMADTALWNAVASRVKRQAFDNTEAGKMAKKVADMLSDELKRMREAGVDVGEYKGYFPDRELNDHAIISNRQKFEAAATRAYMKDGASVAEAKQKAEDWVKAIMLGNHDAQGSPFMPATASPNSSFTKARNLSNEASQIIRDAGFYYESPLESLTTYFYRTSRKSAFERRFGGKDEEGRGSAKYRELEQRLLDEGNGELINTVKTYLPSLLGEMPSTNTTAALRKGVSFLQTANVITYLSGVGTLLTSLPEPLIAASRTGKASDLPKAAAFTFRNIAVASAKKFGLDQDWAKSMSQEQSVAAAEMIGIMSHRMLNDTMLHNRLGGDMANRTNSMLVQRVLSLNGIVGLTRMQRAAALEIGAKFINQLASETSGGTGGKLTKSALSEIGIPEGKHAEFSKWLASQQKAEYGGIKLDDLNADSDMHQLYREALYRFTSQSIMNPNRGQMPRVASHPVGKVAYGLLSYTHAYADTVLKRSIRMGKEAVTGSGYNMSERMSMLTPAMIAFGVIPMMQYALMPVRDELNGLTKDQEERREKETVLGVKGKTMESLQRSGVFGQYEPIINLVTGMRYNRDMANVLLGASGGGLASFAQSAINYADSEKNSPNTNSAERKLATDFWATTVEPSVVTMSAMYLPTPLALPVQLGIKNKRVRDGAVDTIAGERRGGEKSGKFSRKKFEGKKFEGKKFERKKFERKSFN